MKTHTLPIIFFIACFLPTAHAQVTPVPLDLSVLGGRVDGISTPSHDVVFAIHGPSSGNSKAFFRSTDAGANWTTVEIPEPAERTGMSTYALNDDLVWVTMSDRVGTEGGSVWRSSDGGDNWQSLTTTEFAGGFANFSYFTTPDSGMAMGDPNGGYFEIYTTTNGGSTWVRTPQADIPAPLSGEYGTAHDYSAVGSHVWFDTNKGRILMSDDLGLHWTLSPIPAGLPSSANVTFADALHGASHHLLSYFAAYITNDGGLSWTPQAIAPSLQVSYIRAIPGVPGTFVFNAQSPARVLVTTDNFATYTTLASTTGLAYALTDIRMFDASIGWIPAYDTFQAQALFKVENVAMSAAAMTDDRSPMLQVFPNPGTEGAALVTMMLEGAERGELRLVDATGRTVRTTNVSGAGEKRAVIMDLHGVPAGSYLLSFTTAQGMQAQRVVVQ